MMVKFLCANNGAAPTFEAVSSDFVKISSTTMSGEASEFDLTFDTSTYNQFKIYICGLNLSYDANLYVRFRIGTTFDTGNNYYGGTIKKYASGFDSSTYHGNIKVMDICQIMLVVMMQPMKDGVEL